MFETYIAISVFLIIIGIASAAYFTNSLKRVGLIPLSESLITILIGLLHLYCACVLMQIAEKLPPVNNSMAEEMTDLVFEEVNETTTMVNLEASSEVTPLNQDDFLLKYQAFIKNVLMNKSRKGKELEFPQNGTSSEEQCYEEMVMEQSLFLFSFLHCIGSILLGNMQCEEKMIRATKKQTSILISKILATWLVPIIMIGSFYYIMMREEDNSQKVPEIDANIMTIIKNPINTTINQDHDQINDVIRNIYHIVNTTQNSSEFFKTRQGKELRECKNLLSMKLYTLIMLVLYFLTILYGKVKQAKTQDKNSSYSIASFSMLWFPGIFELFSKMYLFDGQGSKVARDMCLTLGDLNRLSIALGAYFSAKTKTGKVTSVKTTA